MRGGSTIVTLPSFGSDAGSNDPNLPGRTSVKEQQGPAITIVATSRSGGAFDFYGKLAGDNYTVYVDTNIGTAVMQFAEVNPSAHGNAGTLVGPQGIRNNLPAGLPHERVVIKCRLDASGNLRNLQVLEPGPAAMTAKIMAALPSWKFRPSPMRGQQAVEVNAILGFNIDTNDRYERPVALKSRYRFVIFQGTEARITIRLVVGTAEAVPFSTQLTGGRFHPNLGLSLLVDYPTPIPRSVC